MKKLLPRRKAVSSIIGGIIVLTLILTALTSIVYIAQQYDAYQNTVNSMSQKDIDRSAENINAIYPGIMGPQLVDSAGRSISLCVSGLCYNMYTMTLTNSGGVGTQVARIYINSTSTCNNLCIFTGNSGTDANPSNLAFDSSESFVNPGEAGHVLTFWLSSALSLPQDSVKANTVSVATARGRVFTFQWPFAPSGDYLPTDLHLDTGPIRIIYDPNLLTFTMNSTNPYTTPGRDYCANSYPSSIPCLQGGWSTPIPKDQRMQGIVFYVRLSNIGSGSVTILDKSYILARGWTATDPTTLKLSWFYVIKPMPHLLCQTRYFNYSYPDSSWPSSGNCPTPGGSTFQSYNSTGLACVSGPCYQLPPGPSLGFSGQFVYVLFSAPTLNGASPNLLLYPNYNYVLYLQLFYIYLGYQHTVTIPLIPVITTAQM
jgi:hypothetical protein